MQIKTILAKIKAELFPIKLRYYSWGIVYRGDASWPYRAMGWTYQFSREVTSEDAVPKLGDTVNKLKITDIEPYGRHFDIFLGEQGTSNIKEYEISRGWS